MCKYWQVTGMWSKAGKGLYVSARYCTELYVVCMAAIQLKAEQAGTIALEC